MKNYYIKIYSDSKRILSKEDIKDEEEHEKESEYKITFNRKRVKNK